MFGEEDVDDDLSQFEFGVDGSVSRVSDGPLFATQAPPTTETPPIRFSVSLIKDYVSCPAKAYARITKQPSKKTLALVCGIACHTGLEEYAKYRNDPVQAFSKSFRMEADRAQIKTNSDDYAKKYSEGELMLYSGVEILNQNGFIDKIDPELVESFFSIQRDGRTFVGKMDLMHLGSDGLSVVDYKTSKNAPNKTELDNDLQFSMYAYAAGSDEKLKTFGLWPTRNVWLHLRGKNISGSRKKDEKVFQYSFPTGRTKEQVERDFQESIDPVVRRIERGDWSRVRGAQCTWCSYSKLRDDKFECAVDLPKVV